jgi:hypothetical protein
MAMVWGEEVDSETHRNKKCGGHQRREKEKKERSGKKNRKTKKKSFFVSMVPIGIDRSPPPGGV